MPRTLSLLAVLKKIDAKGLKSLSNAQWDTFLVSDTEPNEIQDKIKKLEGYEEKGFIYDKKGEVIVEDNQAIINRFKERTGRASGKESLKVKRSKINVKSFKEDFLNKKEASVKEGNTVTSSLTKFKSSARNADLSLPKEETSSSDSKKDGMGDVLRDIWSILKLQLKLDKKESADERKERERQKKEKREKAIESLKGGVKAAANAGKKIVGTLVSPLKSVWEKIATFLKFTVIGALFNGALNWFGEEENRQKMGRVWRFLKYWWPSILAGYLAFFTPIGALVTGVVSLLTWALPALAAVSTNPLLIGAALFSAGKIVPELFPDLKMNEADQEIDNSIDNVGREETIKALSTEYNTKLLEFQESRNIFKKAFLNEELLELEKKIKILTESNISEEQEGNTDEQEGNTDEKEQSFLDLLGIQEFNTGGLVNNFNLTKNYNKGGSVPGSGNKDTVPAMLTPGEFVMSKGAVNKFGVNTLAGMNSAAGGTNKPQYKEGRVHALGGGHILLPKQSSITTSQPKRSAISQPKMSVMEMMKDRWSRLRGNKWDSHGGTSSWSKVKDRWSRLRGNKWDSHGGTSSWSKVKAKGKAIPVKTPIKVRTESSSIVLPTIKKEKAQDLGSVREGSTIPTFDITSTSPLRGTIVMALGIEV